MVKHTQIISKTLLVWLGIALLELFVVRDFAWIFEHWEVKRVIVNFGLTALAMLSLLFILSPIIRHSKTGKNLIFALYNTPTISDNILNFLISNKLN
ncbi:MAG: hypothetical protein Ctma_1050 [Catillopecten margaritatus gill symbiont]|uniref:Uncharacterized protein n=1 Tax=Catillopecten margaritatus gill symbiont TaxID=3083288 RepID=A0AAU6PH39_9GAMM